MFLIDRPAGSTSLRADLAPRQLFGGAGDLVRAALVARPPAADPAMPLARHATSERDLALPAPTRRRRTS
jgi:hypothetical protein